MSRKTTIALRTFGTVAATLMSNLSLCSCSSLFTVGVRQLHWEGMNVRQEGPRFNPESISSFSQLAYRPEEATPTIAIRMPDGRFIPSDELSRDSLKRYLEIGSAYENQSGITVNYSRGRMCVYLDDNGRMTWMIINVRCVYSHHDISGKPPAIRMPDREKILEFPLKEEELRELLGEPTKDETYLFNT